MCLNETYGKVRIGKHLYDDFPTQNGPKQGDALSPLLFNFALECVIRRVQENQMGLKLHGSHQPLVYADDLNLLGDKINTIKKNTEAFIYASKEVGLEVKAEKTKCMLPPRHQNAEKDHDINIVDKCFENVAQFRYLGTTVTNQNLIHEEVKRRLNSCDACRHSVQNLLSSRLVSKISCGSVWVGNLVSDIKGGTCLRTGY
jgi:hypothetical protein